MSLQLNARWQHRGDWPHTPKYSECSRITSNLPYDSLPYNASAYLVYIWRYMQTGNLEQGTRESKKTLQRKILESLGIWENKRPRKRQESGNTSNARKSQETKSGKRRKSPRKYRADTHLGSSGSSGNTNTIHTENQRKSRNENNPGNTRHKESRNLQEIQTKKQKCHNIQLDINPPHYTKVLFLLNSFIFTFFRPRSRVDPLHFITPLSYIIYTQARRKKGH